MLLAHDDTYKPPPTPAWLDGWHAQRLRYDVEACPYDLRTQLASCNHWQAGWHARRKAEKAAAHMKLAHDDDVGVNRRDNQ